MNRNINDVLRELSPDLDVAMGRVAMIAAAALSTTLGQPGSGRVYPRGKGRAHRASRPGEPPAPDTGNLRRSVFVERMAYGVWRVGVNTPYAAALEFGTMKMAPRPFMQRAIDMTRKQLGTWFGASGPAVMPGPAPSRGGTR